MIHPQAIRMCAGKEATSPFIPAGLTQASRDGLYRRLALFAHRRTAAG